MEAKKTSVKRDVFPVPKDLKDADVFIGKIGELKRKILAIELRFNQRVEKLKAKALEIASVHDQKLEKLFDGLYAYAELHRSSLTDSEKRKTVQLPSGAIQWRMTPPKVNIRDTEEVLSELYKLGLERFIRKVEEPDKEAMLKERSVAESVNGVSVTQSEEFIVKPNELDVEIIKKKKLKKTVS